MNKKLIAIGMVLVFLVIGFSGCSEQNGMKTGSTTSDSDNEQDGTNSPIEFKNVKMTTSGTKGESNEDEFEHMKKDFENDKK